MPASTTHVTLDPSGVLRTLVLRDPGLPDVNLTVRGAAPDRLRYLGQLWSATYRSVAPDEYEYRPIVVE